MIVAAAAAAGWQGTGEVRQSHTTFAHRGPGTRINRLYDYVIKWALWPSSDCYAVGTTLLPARLRPHLMTVVTGADRVGRRR